MAGQEDAKQLALEIIEVIEDELLNDPDVQQALKKLPKAVLLVIKLSLKILKLVLEKM